MPSGYPDSSDFDPSQIKDYSAEWEFKRKATNGGKDYGKDFRVPDGSVVVDFETHEKSRHNTKGNPDIYLVVDKDGFLNVPVGVHVGIRLTPDDLPGGAGASFAGEIKMKVVSKSDWFKAIKIP